MGVGCCLKKHEDSEGIYLNPSNNEEIKSSNQLEKLVDEFELKSDDSQILISDDSNILISSLHDLPFTLSVSTRSSILNSLKIRIFGKRLSADSTMQIEENKPYSNGFYTGQLLNGLRSGLGRLQMNNSFYIGEWENDMPSGLGYLKQPLYSSYKGSFLNGKYHGYGEYKIGKAYYKGNWCNGKKHGNGKEKLDGFYYSGSFEHGRKTGNGKLKYAQGSEIVGVFRKNKLIVGEYSGFDGVTIQGTWHNSVLSNCDISVNDQLSIRFPDLSNSHTAILNVSGCSSVEAKLIADSRSFILELIN